MGIEVLDTVKSAFGRLNTETGLKLVGLLFVIQLVNVLSTTLYQAGTALSFLGGALTVASIIAAVMAGVGALRSLDSGSFKREQYLDNMLWPVTRLIGANVVTTVLAYIVAMLVALPVVAFATLTGTGLMISGSILSLALTSLALAVGVAGFLYIFLTLVVAVPIIATGDRRMFEALDISVQRTRGNKNSMFLALLSVIALYLAATALIAVIPAQGSTLNIALGAVSALIGSIVTVAFLSMLTEYDQRLPEA